MYAIPAADFGSQPNRKSKRFPAAVRPILPFLYFDTNLLLWHGGGRCYNNFA